jgi:hypothetical protein
VSVDFNNRVNEDKIVGEGTIQLGETISYDFAVDDVVITIDGVVITIPAGSFVQKGKKEKYQYISTSGIEPKIKMTIDFEKGEWDLNISKIDAGFIDNSDGVKITLTIGDLFALELLDMQVGGLLISLISRRHF